MEKEYVNVDWYLSNGNECKLVAQGRGGLEKVLALATSFDELYVQGPGGYIHYWLTDEESEEEIIMRLNAEIEFWSIVDQG